MPPGVELRMRLPCAAWGGARTTIEFAAYLPDNRECRESVDRLSGEALDER